MPTPLGSRATDVIRYHTVGIAEPETQYRLATEVKFNSVPGIH